MRHLISADYRQFVAEAPIAVVHFDAGWDVKGLPIVRRKMLEAEQEFGGQANFAEVDCDGNLELSQSIPVMNVPLVAYYRAGQLVAALIGANQDVRARVKRVLRGDPIGYDDGTTQANA